MGCCDGCIKYLLFFFNLIFSLSGLALIVVGSILLSKVVDYDNLLSELDSDVTAPQITLIVVGVIIFVVATLGCCGAIRESRCMLITFAVFLLSIFVVELAIGIYAVTNFDDVKDGITKGLSKNFEKYHSDQETKEAFDALQKTMHCCGITNGPFDYTTHIPTWAVPDSCCREYKENCAQTGQFWQDGCASALTDFTKDAGKILGGIGIGLSLIEVIGAIFALRLASQVGK